MIEMFGLDKLDDTEKYVSKKKIYSTLLKLQFCPYKLILVIVLNAKVQSWNI